MFSPFDWSKSFLIWKGAQTKSVSAPLPAKLIDILHSPNITPRDRTKAPDMTFGFAMTCCLLEHHVISHSFLPRQVETAYSMHQRRLM
jgi:hypothetical protein